ncbi:unnamed protein product, partial [Heterosigma akashiwo]
RRSLYNTPIVLIRLTVLPSSYPPLGTKAFSSLSSNKILNNGRRYRTPEPVHLHGQLQPCVGGGP